MALSLTMTWVSFPMLVTVFSDFISVILMLKLVRITDNIILTKKDKTESAYRFQKKKELSFISTVLHKNGKEKRK